MTDDPTTAGPLGEAGARLRAIRDRVKSIQGCVSRTNWPCHICDGQLLVVLQDLDALLSAPVVVSGEQLRLHAQEMREAAAANQRPEVMQLYLRQGADLLESLIAAPVVTQEGEEPCP